MYMTNRFDLKNNFSCREISARRASDFSILKSLFTQSGGKIEFVISYLTSSARSLLVLSIRFDKCVVNGRKTEIFVINKQTYRPLD